MKIIITEEQFTNLLDEMAYPASFSMEDFKNLRNFSQRIKYCDQNLERMASGSGRVIYKIDNEKVLKLAKNNKGIAQNEVESEGYLQNYGAVAKVFESYYDNSCVEMELAKRVSASIFRNVVGFDFKYVEPYLHNVLRAGIRDSHYHG